MRTHSLMVAALLCATTGLTACSHSKPKLEASGKTAHHIYIVDVSVSTALVSDDHVASAIINRIGNDMSRDAKLGDTFTVYEAGASDAARMVGHPTITSGYRERFPAARKQLMGQLREIVARIHAQGGDDVTHLTEALEAIHPDCASGRDVVTLVTDGVEESGTYSVAKALSAGKPVNLPAPASRYLAGCRVRFVGFGLTIVPSSERAQLLPSPSLGALRSSWTDYLRAAGVRASDIEYVSVL